MHSKMQIHGLVSLQFEKRKEKMFADQVQSRRNRNSLNVHSRQNGSRRNGNGQNGSRQNGSRRNGTKSLYIHV